MSIKKYSQRSQDLFKSVFSDKSIIGVTGIIFNFKHQEKSKEFITYYENQIKNVIMTRYNRCETIAIVGKWKDIPLFENDTEYGLEPIKLRNANDLYKLCLRLLTFCKKNNCKSFFETYCELKKARFYNQQQDDDYQYRERRYVAQVLHDEVKLRSLLYSFLCNYGLNDMLSHRYTIKYWKVFELLNENHNFTNFKKEVKNRIIVLDNEFL
tara:strand:+ start:321 stop:953 length:633 start_codon:yes stop_codon:yes gene_type:complete